MNKYIQSIVSPSPFCPLPYNQSNYRLSKKGEGDIYREGDTTLFYFNMIIYMMKKIGGD